MSTNAGSTGCGKAIRTSVGLVELGGFAAYSDPLPAGSAGRKTAVVDTPLMSTFVNHFCRP